MSHEQLMREIGLIPNSNYNVHHLVDQHKLRTKALLHEYRLLLVTVLFIKVLREKGHVDKRDLNLTKHVVPRRRPARRVRRRPAICG